MPHQIASSDTSPRAEDLPNGADLRRRWRFYETAAGRREFLNRLSGEDLASVLAAMRHVARSGLVAARHVRGDIYEVREDGEHQTYCAPAPGVPWRLLTSSTGTTSPSHAPGLSDDQRTIYVAFGGPGTGRNRYTYHVRPR